MSKFDEAVQLVKNVIICGGETVVEDWEKIMDQLVGSDDAETIKNIYEFVETTLGNPTKVTDSEL